MYIKSCNTVSCLGPKLRGSATCLRDDIGGGVYVIHRSIMYIQRDIYTFNSHHPLHTTLRTQTLTQITPPKLV